jgi:hypothetical protein
MFKRIDPTRPIMKRRFRPFADEAKHCIADTAKHFMGAAKVLREAKPGDRIELFNRSIRTLKTAVMQAARHARPSDNDPLGLFWNDSFALWDIFHAAQTLNDVQRGLKAGVSWGVPTNLDRDDDGNGGAPPSKQIRRKCGLLPQWRLRSASRSGRAGVNFRAPSAAATQLSTARGETATYLSRRRIFETFFALPVNSKGGQIEYRGQEEGALRRRRCPSAFLQKARACWLPTTPKSLIWRKLPEFWPLKTYRAFDDIGRVWFGNI